MCTKIFGTAFLRTCMWLGTKGMNIHNPFAVAVLKSDVIVGHIASYQEQYRLPVMYSLDAGSTK